MVLEYEEYSDDDTKIVRLAVAVVSQACKDYLYSWGSSHDKWFKEFCINSVWMQVFPNMDGIYIYEQMKKKREERHNGKKTRKPRKPSGDYRQRTIKKVDSSEIKTVDKRKDSASKQANKRI